MGQSIITKHFLHDHHILEGMFAEFCEKKSTDVLNDLRNSLNRHWTEEEILYTSYKGQKDKFLQRIRIVLDQHRIIKSLLEEFYERKDDDTISTIKNLFDEHRNLEEKYVYPEFDENLDENEKQKVIEDLELYEKESKKGTPSKYSY